MWKCFPQLNEAPVAIIDNQTICLSDVHTNRSSTTDVTTDHDEAVAFPQVAEAGGAAGQVDTLTVHGNDRSPRQADTTPASPINKSTTIAITWMVNDA